MIYGFGLLLVVAACMSAATALPPCICTREAKPVCGTDGLTYNNECMLRCKQQTDPSLDVQSAGRCRAARETECACTLEYDPVCGSDGTTYPNKCALECYADGNPELAHRGECKPKREADDQCICPYLYSPVCSTDGRTFSNECLLSCAGAAVEYRGLCREKRQTCFCPLNYAPVCGTNGKTYGNKCSLTCEGNVRVAYQGQCRHRRDLEYEPPVLASEQKDCLCTFEVDPVCGSDGHTYDNMCRLECEGDKVQLDHRGECRQKREDVKIAALSLPKPCQCTREANLVCGTDGKTYSNPCLLNCIREQREDLHIAHPGRCAKGQANVREAEPQPTTCACARNLRPVCASNGVTYNNECLLRCAGEELTVVKDGPCE